MYTSRPRRGTGPRVALLLVLALLLGVSVAVTDALRTPGSETPVEKLAEWARDHGLGPLVTWLEAVRYQVDPPVEGGAPAGGIPPAAGAIGGVPATLAPLAPVAPGSPLPGEGHWHPVVVEHGRPAVQVTTLRPDARHTSYLVGVMWLDPTLVRGQLHPGTTDPGGRWAAGTALAGPDENRVAAVFNGGFKLSDPSHNGYYSEGRTVAPLVPGRASLVLYDSGAADIGAWGSEVRMGPDVASVRQNLVPLVDAGQVNPSCGTGGEQEWGNTIGQQAYVVRSGFGVTASGAEVYVGGPALSVCTLGRILVDAGVVRGMELDINPDWVSGTYFHQGTGAGRAAATPIGFRLFPAEQVDPGHYLTPSARDWFAWYLR